jgi:predicted nuclease with TOPRIM domain
MEIMEYRMLRQTLFQINDKIGDDIRKLKYKIIELRNECDETFTFDDLRDENFYLREKTTRIITQLAEYEKQMEDLIVRQAILIKFKEDLNKKISNDNV